MNTETQAKTDMPTHKGAVNVASALNRDIIEGRYKFGEQLPSERVLSEQLGASRGTIRSALSKLENSAMVERIRGSGTFVTHRVQGQKEHVAEVTSPLELISVRLAIEPPMIRMAIINANARDLMQLEQTLKLVEASGANSSEFSKFDEQFHLCLAEITRNPLMVWLYRHLNEVRGHNQWHRVRDKILTQARIDAYNAQHRRLFEAINNRDAEQAEETIIEHLEQSRLDLLGAKTP